jgi:sterol desaturase/sphingolipid hydroxylase (fatty acid hydroxylase superfamily)
MFPVISSLGTDRPFCLIQSAYASIIGALSPKTALFKQYHLRHHFISEKHWFGVSNPTLDGVFGTFRGPDAAEKSATTRKLYS